MSTERSLIDLLHARLGTTATAAPGMPPRYVLAEHVRLNPTYGTRIADAIAVDTWGSGGFGIHGYEVKTSRADWRRELEQPSKAEAWARHCSFWWLIAPAGVVRDDLPPGWGHLTVRGDGRLVQRVAAPLRPTPLPLPPATLAGLVRAVAQTAAARAHQRSTPAPLPIDDAPVLVPKPMGERLPDQVLYAPGTCPLFDCVRTHAHTHPERTR